MFRYISNAFLIISLFTPVIASAQNMPIEMVASNDSSTPLMNNNYTTIGYWDVDDWDGNGADSFFSPNLGPAYSGVGTHQFADGNETVGSFMAALGVNVSDLHLITALNTSVSDNSVDATVRGIRTRAPQNNPNSDVIYTDNSETEYVVGVWDVDGGGGFGNDGSNGTYAMVLTARLGTNPSDRKLIDLFLIASNRSSPTLREGYDVVGYWDVDSGGARGTNDRGGSYMMTLLAKWE